jgi:two-component system sensor histidine kinase TctE
MAERGQAGSIQSRLLRVLMVSLMGLLGLCAGVTWFVAFRVATDAYDHGLLDPLMDIVQNVREGAAGPSLALSPREQEALLFDGSDRVFFGIRDARGRWFAGGAHDIPRPPERLAPRKPQFYSATVSDAEVRIAEMITDAGFEVYVAETTNKRDRLVWEVILTGLVPSLLVVVVAVALVWLGVSHGLAPLRRLHDELANRSPNDLRDVDLSHAPAEVRSAIVALNRLLLRIRETSESQRRFLADAAHQLRTPLAGLQMQLELELRASTSPSLRATLVKLRDAVLRTVNFTNRLLSLARAEQAAPVARDDAAIDLCELAERVGAQWIAPALDRGIDLGFDLAPAPVYGDSALLADMLQNLIDNAVRYTGPGGSITVSSGENSMGPWLAVEDSGIGIPRAERTRVFERFYRGTTAGVEGSGLGLAIVKEGAERHRASVTIDDPPGGRGTLVCVRFPARSAPSSRATSDVYAAA